MNARHCANVMASVLEKRAHRFLDLEPWHALWVVEKGNRYWVRCACKWTRKLEAGRIAKLGKDASIDALDACLTSAEDHLEQERAKLSMKNLIDWVWPRKEAKA